MKNKILKSFLVVALIGLVPNLSLAEGLQPFSQQVFEEAQAEGKAILLDFHAAWCGVCRKQKVILEKIFKEDSFSEVVALSVDYDNAAALKKQLGVRKQSTLVVFKGKNEVARSTGETKEDKIRNLINQGIEA